jgi:hypothetical protein
MGQDYLRFVIQWHGWATILASPDDRDTEASEEEQPNRRRSMKSNGSSPDWPG